MITLFCPCFDSTGLVVLFLKRIQKMVLDLKDFRNHSREHGENFSLKLESCSKLVDFFLFHLVIFCHFH